ncbi:MAG: hypothetical protein D6797_02735 [Bdellovibrio sp.]|nr:MAG: hypothetical protein D6797_02735 [Bdellovibrio sp.]
MEKENNLIPEEDWWIDYLEGEIERKKKQTMDLLLKYSITDRKILNNFSKMKTLIQITDPAEKFTQELINPKRLKKLENKIMKAINSITKKESRMSKKKKLFSCLPQKQGPI